MMAPGNIASFAAGCLVLFFGASLPPPTLQAQVSEAQVPHRWDDVISLSLRGGKSPATPGWRR